MKWVGTGAPRMGELEWQPLASSKSRRSKYKSLAFSLLKLAAVFALVSLYNQQLVYQIDTVSDPISERGQLAELFRPAKLLVSPRAPERRAAAPNSGGSSH